MVRLCSLGRSMRSPTPLERNPKPIEILNAVFVDRVRGKDRPFGTGGSSVHLRERPMPGVTLDHTLDAYDGYTVTVHLSVFCDRRAVKDSPYQPLFLEGPETFQCDPNTAPERLVAYFDYYRTWVRGW